MALYARCPLHLVERRRVPAASFAQRRGHHVADARLLRPLDALLLAVPQLSHAEVAALGLHAVIGQDRSDLSSVRQHGELGAVADRRAQLEPGHPDVGHHLDEGGEVPEHRPQGVDLAPDRQAQRIRAKARRTRGQEPGPPEDAPRHDREGGGSGRRPGEELASLISDAMMSASSQPAIQVRCARSRRARACPRRFITRLAVRFTRELRVLDRGAEQCRVVPVGGLQDGAHDAPVSAAVPSPCIPRGKVGCLRPNPQNR